MQLRPYQIDIIEKCRSSMKSGLRSILVQSPTGSGKTLLTAFMLKTAAEKGMNSWFLVHRRELIKQSIETFSKVGIRFGVVAAGFLSDPKHSVQIASVQTVARRLHLTDKPSLVVWDEAHHLPAAGWNKVRESTSNSFHIGLTATPERLDGKGLGDYFKVMVHGPTVKWLIENKYLSPYRLFAPSSVSLAGVHTRMGDFVKSELQSVVDRPTITGDAIRHYQSHGNGKRAVVFCVSIEHSKHVVAQFQAAGISAAHVDGETDVRERDNTIKMFESGEIRILSNVELFGEGFDLPAIEVAILLRPTQSLGLYLQQVGRSLRILDGKTQAIVLDHAGNCQRHGLPDEERDWSLAGHERKKRSADGSTVPSVRVCPKCFAAQPAGVVSCKVCNHVFEVQSREVESVDGQLMEVDQEAFRRQVRKEQGQAQSFDDLVQLGKRRGYRSPYAWAKYVFNARQKRKLAGLA